MTTETNLCSVCNQTVDLDYEGSGKAVHIESETGDAIFNASHAVNVAPKLNLQDPA